MSIKPIVNWLRNQEYPGKWSTWARLADTSNYFNLCIIGDRQVGEMNFNKDNMIL